jgi:hypothetical protein
MLPMLWRDMTARRVIAGLPLLDASPTALSSAHLWRASVVMACLAYSSCAATWRISTCPRSRVARGDRTAVALLIVERLRHVTDVCLSKVSPNRHAALRCDPLLWAKLVAPTGIAITREAPGFGGTQSTPVALLDAFITRNRCESHVGGETRRVRK